MSYFEEFVTKTKGWAPFLNIRLNSIVLILMKLLLKHQLPEQWLVVVSRV